MALSKEQGQRIFLATILMVILMVVFWMLLIRPLNGKRMAALAEITDATKERRIQDALAGKADEVSTAYAQTRERLAAVLTDQMPPDTNPMAWASAVIRRAAESAGIGDHQRALTEITVARTASAAPRSRAAASKQPPMLSQYAVSIELTCGYHQLGRFLATLESEIPFVQTRALTVEAEHEGERLLRVGMECRFPRLNAEAFPPEVSPLNETPRMPVEEEKGEEK